MHHNYILLGPSLIVIWWIWIGSQEFVFLISFQAILLMQIYFNTSSRSVLNCGVENGNPLEYSCQENPMDRGAWWPTVQGVEKSRTCLSN